MGWNVECADVEVTILLSVEVTVEIEPAKSDHGWPTGSECGKLFLPEASTIQPHLSPGASITSPTHADVVHVILQLTLL
jgi:hypothetical protein